jgi:hypothetical protein
VASRHAADISGLFNTTSRIGGVIGVAVFGTAYLDMAPGPGRSTAVTGFATVALALAGTAVAAALMAYLAIRKTTVDRSPVST